MPDFRGKTLVLPGAGGWGDVGTSMGLGGGVVAVVNHPVFSSFFFFLGGGWGGGKENMEPTFFLGGEEPNTFLGFVFWAILVFFFGF